MPTDEEFLAYNQGIVREFRANGGVVAQLPFPIMLLTTTGARTCKRTTTPVGLRLRRPRVRGRVQGRRSSTRPGSTTCGPTRR